jgi:tetratricopeptide (TPR) repeat protein
VLHSRAAAYYRTQRTVGPRGWRDIAELQPQIFEYEHLVMAGESDAAAMLLGEYAGAIAHCGHPTHCRDLFLKLPDQFKSDSARVMYGVAALVWKSYLGPVFEGLKMGEQALQLSLAMKDEPLELLVRGELVIAYRYAGDSAHSREHAEQIAERIAGSPGTASNAALLEDCPGFNLVLAYTYQGDIRRAAPLAHQDYDLALRSRKPVFIATALNGMAVLYFGWGRYADAVRFGTEAEAVWMPGFHDGIAYVKNIVGMSHFLLGDYPAAVAKLADAITTADEWDSPRPGALAHWNLSLVNLLHGVYDAAARHGREAEVLMTRLSLDRTASAPRLAAEAALNHDTAGVVRALLAAAREWTTCGDLFPGTRLADHAGRLAHAHQLDALAADADALTAELNARLILPLESPALGA